MKPNTDEVPPVHKKPRLALAIATALGLGYVPKVPGTIGSLAGIAVAVLSDPVSLLLLIPGWGVEAPRMLGHQAPVLFLVPSLLALLLVAVIGTWGAARYARSGAHACRVADAPHPAGCCFQFRALLCAEPAQLEILAGGFYTFSRLRYLEAVSRAATGETPRRLGNHGRRLDGGGLRCSRAAAGDPTGPGMKFGESAAKNGIPRIDSVTPAAVIPSGELVIQGSGFSPHNRARPVVRFGEVEGSVLLATENRLIARVPDGASGGTVRVVTAANESRPHPVAIGMQVADNLHPVANPAVDVHGNIYVTFSGQRGERVPVSLYKITANHAVKPYVTALMNPTGLALDRAGSLFVSCRNDGTIYRITPEGRPEKWMEGMGIATGLAFDGE